ncbi:MAG: hypothetical protein F4239_02810 [Gammaproteobacteria bacterium]|nr:hypothetical protein [Gammaproteobacteria bacterium]MYD77861.1 hypothetical protein [Gammaproteobacteria bacterium]MYI89884.1 hypothetical protein [Gammaproteobacteria bacterium]
MLMSVWIEQVIDFLHRQRFRSSASIRARFWMRLASLSRSDVPIAAALDFLCESKVEKSASLHFARHQRTAIRSHGFSSGAIGWVPQEELAIIQITQEGRIEEGFEQAARMATVRSKLRTTLISGLTYPLLLLFGGGLVITLLPGQALSSMTAVLDQSKWPAVSVSVLEFSNFLSNWGIAILTGIALLLIVSIWAAPRWAGSVREKFEWFPPFALYRQFSGPEILSALLALMQAGVQRIKALKQLESGLPKYLASHVQKMRSNLYRGESVDQALDTGLFSPETLDTLRIYERIGDFAVHAERIADEDLERALQNLNRITKTFASVLLLGIGAIAIWIYIGIARVVFTLQQSTF